MLKNKIFPAFIGTIFGLGIGYFGPRVYYDLNKKINEKKFKKSLEKNIKTMSKILSEEAV